MMNEDQFVADHAPGSMQLSASLMPCLVVPPEHRPRWAPSPLSYGLHLIGDSPLPDGDMKTLRRGKLMEPIGEVLLREDHGIVLLEEQVRRHMPELPAVCYLDGLLSGCRMAVEFKSMPERIYRDQWESGPPLWVRVQTQAQQMIDQKLVGVLIVPIVISYAGNPDIPQVYEEPRDDEIGGMLVSTGQAFLRMLKRRELPAPDETIASYDAIMRTLKIDPDKIVTLADDADAVQFRAWQMAKVQKTGGEKLDDASKRYFAARAGDAAIIEIPGVGRIERKQRNVSAEKEPRPARVDTAWNLRENL